VIGGGIKKPPRRANINQAAAAGAGLLRPRFRASIHDGEGLLTPLGVEGRKGYDECFSARPRSAGPWQVVQESYSDNQLFRKSSPTAQPNGVGAGRAGGRYLYICENASSLTASSRAGHSGGVALESTPSTTSRREFMDVEVVARPYATVGCVHRVSTMTSGGGRGKPPRNLEAQSSKGAKRKVSTALLCFRSALTPSFRFTKHWTWLDDWCWAGDCRRRGDARSSG